VSLPASTEARPTNDQVGYVLAGDYLGAMLGAVATGTLLIPTLGVPASILLLSGCLAIGLVTLKLART
jgi:predicted membrane-bound spermidine synthase